MTYDSTHDTMQHIQAVQGFLGEFQDNLFTRSAHHDDSKLQEPEKSMYDKFTPMLRGLTYGSPEYKQCLVDMGPALQHHYENNSHHPEHFKMLRCPICNSIFPSDAVPLDLRFEGEIKLCPKCCASGTIMECELQPAPGICGMSLLDVLEMLADWRAAGMRHADGSMAQSLEINRKRFEISDQLFEILKNTVRELGW